MNPNEIPKSALLFARYDGKVPRIIEDKKGDMVPYFIDKNGIPVYVSEDKKLVSQIITRSSKKYRLFRTKPFYMKVTDVATGSSRWEMSVPWNYRIETYSAGTDPKNGETIYKTRVVWYEDPEGKEVVVPTVEFLTGEKDPSESPSQINNAKIDAVKAKAEVEKLRESYSDLLKKVDALMSQNEALLLRVSQQPDTTKEVPKDEARTGPGRPSGKQKFSLE
ncbi:MAG: hypothetical protein WC998_04645 [Candidatus Paceibacterota bacterium]|jgi:hypothetical protein